MPAEPDEDESLRRGVAETVVLAAYHLWRMPVRLLIPHVAYRMHSAFFSIRRKPMT